MSDEKVFVAQELIPGTPIVNNEYFKDANVSYRLVTLKNLETDSNRLLSDIGNKKRDRAPGTERSKDGGKTVSWSELVRGGEQKMVRL